VVKAPAYYETATITAVKSFIINVPENCAAKGEKSALPANIRKRQWQML
jgi:hypothetical protein